MASEIAPAAIKVSAIATEKDRQVACVTIETENGRIDLYVTNWSYNNLCGFKDHWRPLFSICPELLEQKLRAILS